jgi:DNA replicative helicase MCM subunit Mcm2 (Cdc46/Mcm family)
MPNKYCCDRCGEEIESQEINEFNSLNKPLLCKNCKEMSKKEQLHWTKINDSC